MAQKMSEQEIREWLELGLKFHGHLCGGMPLGFRAGLAAREALDVPREPDSNLVALAETGEFHLAGCWVDGIMLATGCTYGKGNIAKLFWGKWAVTLIDGETSRAVRVAVKPEVLEKAFSGPFIAERKKGIPPSKVDQRLARPMFESMATAKSEDIFDISDVFELKLRQPSSLFSFARCEECGEITVTRYLRVTPEGKRVCIPCAGEIDDYSQELLTRFGGDLCVWPSPPK